PLFSGSSIGDFTNNSLLGASPEQLSKWKYSVTSVPSIDGRIAQCSRAVGGAQAACWAEADQVLMEQIAPVVPILFVTATRIVSERVRHFSWDQFATLPALDQIALQPGSD
ncbi:MAG TPA: hypothetical protein VKA30_04825, partial [Actinomycetota bacterium]|nr:hypothetical protein [Actinomycetota bacterium]